MITNTDASTPNTAPRLFRKYRSPMRLPGSCGASLRSPDVISGNVAPSSADCGRIRSAASAHDDTHQWSTEHVAGRSASYAQAVAATNTAWNRIPAQPTTNSAAA